MFNALQKEFPEIEFIGPVRKNTRLVKIIELITIVHKSLLSGRYNKLHNIIRSKYYAREFEKKLKNKDLDLIFAPAGSTEIAYLKTNIPICYLSDTSFGQIKDYYETFSVFSKLSNYESEIIEKRALKKASHVVYSSEWAANFVHDNYEVDLEKLSVIPFGANIDNTPDIDILEKDYTGTIQILFVSKYWRRKGGDIVLTSFKRLIDKGMNVKLVILGCKPEIEPDENIKIIPFLDKNDEDQSRQFLDIFKKSHLFFLPTRADCTPIVFCEANAFALPVITTDTGGVKSIINNKENGLVLPLSATAEDFADELEVLITNPEKIKMMSEKSREKFEYVLNWENWAKSMCRIFEDIKANTWK